MILLIDNYDSFVHNVARYFQRLGQETVVVRNDATTLAEVRRQVPAAIVLSPGPCTPSEAGCSIAVVRELSGEIPILGVCLGHQTIAAAFGARVVRAPEPRHGRTSLILHDDSPVFAGTPSPFRACRYHSLIVDEASLPASLRVTARADDGCVMGIERRGHQTFGLQFHPESTLTDHGYALLANFLRIAGASVPADVESITSGENRMPPPERYPEIEHPITF
jgi:anthranilate synthase/aminodeoxychorismate synthase-like glutamine amidotransferase